MLRSQDADGGSGNGSSPMELTSQSATDALTAANNTLEVLSKSAFVFAVARVLLALQLLGLLTLVALLLLFAVDAVAYVPRSGAAQLFFLLFIPVCVFSVFWAANYAPTRAHFLTVIVVDIVASLGAAPYAYLVYDGDYLAATMFGFFGLALAAVVPIHRRMFDSYTILPVDEHTLETWLTVYRLFIIVVAPIVSNYIRNDGAASMQPMYAVVSFQLSMCEFVGALRLGYAIMPQAKSIAGVLQRLTVPQIIRFFGSFTLLFGTFIVFYLSVISGSTMPQAGVIVLLVVTGISYLWFVFFLLSIYAPKSPLRFFDPLTPQNYVAFEEAQARGGRDRKELCT